MSIKSLEIGIYTKLVDIAKGTGNRVNIYRESEGIGNTVTDSIIEACTFMIAVKSGSFESNEVNHTIDVLGVGTRTDLLTFLDLFVTGLKNFSVMNYKVNPTSYEWESKTPDQNYRSLTLRLIAISDIAVSTTQHPFLTCN